MNKQEFVDRLRAALNGKVSPNLVTEYVNYYEDYINTEIRKGRTEEEVLESLGEPRLLAHTIIETNGKTGTAEERNAGYRSYAGNGYQNTDRGNRAGDRNEVAGAHIHLPGWLWTIIVIILVVVLLSAVFSILSFLAPAILVFLVVIFLVKLFRDWLN